MPPSSPSRVHPSASKSRCAGGALPPQLGGLAVDLGSTDIKIGGLVGSARTFGVPSHSLCRCRLGTPHYFVVTVARPHPASVRGPWSLPPGVVGCIHASQGLELAHCGEVSLDCKFSLPSFPILVLTSQQYRVIRRYDSAERDQSWAFSTRAPTLLLASPRCASGALHRGWCGCDPLLVRYKDRAGSW